MQQDNAVYDPKVHETLEVVHKTRKGGDGKPARKTVYAARLPDYEATGWSRVGKAAAPAPAGDKPPVA